MKIDTKEMILRKTSKAFKVHYFERTLYHGTYLFFSIPPNNTHFHLNLSQPIEKLFKTLFLVRKLKYLGARYTLTIFYNPDTYRLFESSGMYFLNQSDKYLLESILNQKNLEKQLVKKIKETYGI